MVSKHWDFPSVKLLLRPLLFWEGDTAKIEEFDRAKMGRQILKKERQPIHEEVTLG